MFNDREFFNNFNPMILLEPISLKGKNSLKEIISLLKKFGYSYNIFDQEGGVAPLVLFRR